MLGCSGKQLMDIFIKYFRKEVTVRRNQAFTAVADMVAEVNFHSKRHWAIFGHRRQNKVGVLLFPMINEISEGRTGPAPAQNKVGVLSF